MKIKLKTQSFFNQQAVKQRSDKNSIGALYKASAYLRTTARRSIRKSAQPAQPGQPPHTRLGQLKTSIVFAVDEKNLTALVGPAASLISDISKYHEFGGTQTSKSKRRTYRIGAVGPIAAMDAAPRFAPLKTARQVQRATKLDRQLWSDQSLVKKRRYPRRPFMGPALQASASQLKSIFRVSLSPATSL